MKSSPHQLRPYQQDGVEYILERKRAALFWEPRTGKTPTVLSAAERLRVKNLLIVVPASLQRQWRKECRVWAPSCHPLIVSYHHIQKEEKAAFLSQYDWDMIIVDEAHALKSWTAKQTVHFLAKIETDKGEYLPLYRKTKKMVILTGTPSTNSAEDYHSILSMLAPGKLGKLGDWKKRHCELKTIGFGRYKREVWSGYKDTERINRLVKRYASVLKYSDVVKQMPKTQHSRFYVDVDTRIPEYEIKPDGPPESILPMLRQLGIEKAAASIEWLEEFKEPVVVFAWFRGTIRFLQANLPNVVGTVTGEDSHENKAASIRRFLRARGRSFILCNLAAGAVGTDLSVSDCSVFIELPYSPAIYDQACARIIRPEKRRPVEIVSVIAEGSYDDRILKILRGKAKGMKEILAG